MRKIDIFAMYSVKLMGKSTKKKLGLAVAVSFVIVILLVLAFARYGFYAAGLRYGFILLCIISVAFLVWKAFIYPLNEKLKAAEAAEADLARRLEQKEVSGGSIVNLNQILHLTTMEVKTQLVKAYDLKEGDVTFNGALKADICAEYGVRLEKARFRYDAGTHTLYVADLTPGLISYSQRKLTWEFARSYRTRTIFGRTLPSVSDSSMALFTRAKCDELRADCEARLDAGDVPELAWLSVTLNQHILGYVKGLLGDASLNVVTVDAPDESFVDIQALRNQYSGLQIGPQAR